MTIIDTIWIFITVMIIGIVLLVDPKNSVPNSVTGLGSRAFDSPSSQQSFIYRVSAILILLFYVLTILLNL